MLLLTKPLLFDTDCLSAFLWVDNESILVKLYPGRIVIPSQVYHELSYPDLNHIKGLKAQVDNLVSNKQAILESIDYGSAEYHLYFQLTQNPVSGRLRIGNGEAAAIALACKFHGILASNNLSDISQYVQEFHLKHMTTGDIMKEAMLMGLITECQGNVIWGNMLNRKRRLGFVSFSEFLKNNS